VKYKENCSPNVSIEAPLLKKGSISIFLHLFLLRSMTRLKKKNPKKNQFVSKPKQKPLSISETQINHHMLVKRKRCINQPYEKRSHFYYPLKHLISRRSHSRNSAVLIPLYLFYFFFKLGLSHSRMKPINLRRLLIFLS